MPLCAKNTFLEEVLEETSELRQRSQSLNAARRPPWQVAVVVQFPLAVRISIKAFRSLTDGSAAARTFTGLPFPADADVMTFVAARLPGASRGTLFYEGRAVGPGSLRADSVGGKPLTLICE